MTNNQKMLLIVVLSFGLFVLVAQPAQAQDITSGLIGHWKLNETSGTTAADSAGTRDGTMVGGLDASNDSYGGKLNTALLFDGTDDQVEMNPMSVSLPVTLSAWVKIESTPSTAMVFTTNNWDGNRWGGVNIGVTSGDKIYAVMGDGVGTNHYRTKAGNTTLSLDGWHHITAVFNSWTGAADDIVVYVDGKEDGGSYGGNNTSDTVGTTGSAKARIGKVYDYWSSTGFFHGLIDDVRVYNRALTADDIDALSRAWMEGRMRYNHDYRVPEYFDGGEWIAMGPAPLSKGLVGFWKFDEESGEIKDFSGNYNHGTASGGPEYASSGVLGYAMGFDGADDYVRIDDTSEVKNMCGGPGCSVSAWFIKRSDGIMSIASRADNTGDNYFWMLDTSTSTGKVSFEIDVNGNATTVDCSPIASVCFSNNEWVHVVGVWDNINGTCKTYCNKTIVDQATAGVPIDDTAWQDDEDVIIGAFDEGQNRKLHGVVDEVRLYNRPLSAAEVAMLYDMEVPNGLVYRWKMDETSGTTAADSIGAKDGTMKAGMDAATNTAFGRVDSGFSFDGANDYIELPGGLYCTLPITVTAWVKVAPNDGGVVFIPGDRTNLRVSGYRLYASDNVGVHYGDDSATNNKKFGETADNTLTPGRWHHIVAVYNSWSGAADDIQIYIDGVEHSVTFNGTNSDTLKCADGYPGYIGAQDSGSGGVIEGHFKGEIDDIRVYDRALTPDEIAVLSMSCDSPAYHAGSIV